MTEFLLIAGWFASGAAGYYLTRWWWTSDFDWTTSEATAGWFCALLGPMNLAVGLFLAATVAFQGKGNGGRVIKEARR